MSEGKTPKKNKTDGGKGDTKGKDPYEDDAKAPAGSWIQHYADSHMFWRNNHTGETARGLWYESDLHPGCRHLKPASFAPSKPESPEVKEGQLPTTNEPSNVDKPSKPKRIIVGLPVYEEIYDPVTGKKHWRHRKTGKETHTDPYM